MGSHGFISALVILSSIYSLISIRSMVCVFICLLATIILPFFIASCFPSFLRVLYFINQFFLYFIIYQAVAVLINIIKYMSTRKKTHAHIHTKQTHATSQKLKTNHTKKDKIIPSNTHTVTHLSKILTHEKKV